MITAAPDRRRRLVYVDPRLQRWFVASLLLLELAMGAAAFAFLYWDLTELIEESVFRVHQEVPGSLFLVMMQETMNHLLWFLGANLVALWAADRAWARRVDAIRTDFGELMERTRDLDLSSDGLHLARHAIVHLAHAWRMRERARMAALRLDLGEAREAAQRGDRETVAAALRALRKTLP